MELQTKLQDITNVGAGAANVGCHKGCYGTYTSTEKIDRIVKAHKRKAEYECIRVTRYLIQLADKECCGHTFTDTVFVNV